MYTVRRLHSPRSTTASSDVQIQADSPRAAAAASGLAEPGAELIVDNAKDSYRYHVDTRGRIVEQSSYST